MPKRHSKSSGRINRKKVINVIIIIIVAIIYRVVSYIPDITYAFRNAYNVLGTVPGFLHILTHL